MSSNSSQTLPQDPFHVQRPPRVETYLRSDEPSNKREEEEETSTPAPKREELDVKEEPESPGLRESPGETTQPSQPSQLPPERSADPENTTCYQDTSSGSSEAPWVYVVKELRSVQFDCEQLRTRMDSVEVGTDTSELREIQGNLSSRISWFEESVNLHCVNESLHRIISLEESVGHGHVGESFRECHVRVT